MDVFDMIGPVMVGPSSSHTAGAVRIGRMARMVLGDEVAEASITLFGSFAATWKGHGTDKAILSGLLGFEADDERIGEAPSLAEKAGLAYTFILSDKAGIHPNCAEIEARSRSGKTIRLTGSSIGGGSIVINKINGIAVSITGEFHTLIVVHQDVPGVVASVTSVLSGKGINIAAMTVFRSNRGGEAIMVIETDQVLDSGVAGELLKRQGVRDVSVIASMKEG